MLLNKIKIFICGGLLFSVITSCDNFLDIEPQKYVSSEYVYDTEEGVINVLNGIYERLGHEDFLGGTSLFMSDLIGNSGEITWTGTFNNYRQLNQKNMDATDNLIRDKWLVGYKGIDMCNNVLANLSVVGADERERVEGEALFLRAVIYFELVRLYASPYGETLDNSQLGVPLVLEPTSEVNETSLVERASVKKVYDQIITDFTKSKELLEAIEVSSGANGGRATKSVVSAFLSRVYLSTGNWAEAAEESNYVIEVFGGYDALHTNPRAAFNNDNYTSEDVFMISQNSLSNSGKTNSGITTFFASLNGEGRGDVNISEDFIELFEEGDLRVQLTDKKLNLINEVPTMLYIGVGKQKYGRIMSSKWGKHDANIPVIRLAELILTRAEANFRNGSEIGKSALDDINAIRTRSNASVLSALTLEDIKKERFAELAFEGHKLHDLRRFKDSVIAPLGSAYAEEVIQWNDGRLVLPIPQRELDVNKKLVQNTAYLK